MVEGKLGIFLKDLDMNKQKATGSFKFTGRAEALQEKIKARTGTTFDTSALSEEPRQRYDLCMVVYVLMLV